MTTTAVPFAPSSADHDPHGYHALLGAQREHFAIATADAPPLFRTVATGPDGSRLFDLFLSTLPADDRQHYTCNACRHFVDRYGSLVTIDATGATHSVLWGIDTAPPYFDATVRIMAFTVEIARVTGVFYSPDLLWGQPQTGPWSHFAVAATNHRFSHPLLTAGQRMAEKHEDHTMLCRAIAEYPPPPSTPPWPCSRPSNSTAPRRCSASPSGSRASCAASPPPDTRASATTLSGGPWPRHRPDSAMSAPV